MALLATSQIAFAPIDASAVGWCGCGNCWMMYSYPGVCTCGYPYYWCFDDPDPAHVTGSANAVKAEQDSIVNGQGLLLAQAVIYKEEIRPLSGGKCLQNRVASHLLGSNRDTLKFESLSFDGLSTVF